MENTYPKFLASSQDPTKLSLTVSSASQALLFLVGFYAVHKGFDPSAATTQVQGLIDLGINLVPAGLAVYHGVVTAYGLLRKLFALTKTAPTV